MPEPSSPPPGCLGWIFALFGIPPSGSAPRAAAPLVQVKRRRNFLSPGEFAFYTVLKAAVGGEYTICPKVRLGDLFYVPGPQRDWNTHGKLFQKHVDFVLCTRVKMEVVMGVELDDRTHDTKRARERDAIVEQFFADADVPLMRVVAAATYDAVVLRDHVRQLADEPWEGDLE